MIGGLLDQFRIEARGLSQRDGGHGAEAVGVGQLDPRARHGLAVDARPDARRAGQPKRTALLIAFCSSAVNSPSHLSCTACHRSCACGRGSAGFTPSLLYRSLNVVLILISCPFGSDINYVVTALVRSIDAEQLHKFFSHAAGHAVPDMRRND